MWGNVNTETYKVRDPLPRKIIRHEPFGVLNVSILEILNI